MDRFTRERRDFLNLMAAGLNAAQTGTSQTNAVIERPEEGKPHQGKVFALVPPHLDDGPIFAGGTIAKLLKEGYTGYFIRTSNDEKDRIGARWAKPCWRTSKIPSCSPGSWD